MKKFFTFLMMAVLIIPCIVGVSASAADSDLDKLLHRNNIVFVTDESGSMKQTDPNDNRYDAIRLFLGEMADKGNYVGSVSFGEGIVDSSNIQPINGQDAKNALIEDISDQKYSNYTNIGIGLKKAVSMLDNDRNKDLDSAIILLTDGNTDMPDKDTLQTSMEQKADAIDKARKKGYKIYTISLNVNGKADSSELKQIANATGGEFAEVRKAEDLNDVETMFNKMIFDSFEDKDFSNLDLTIGDDGTVTTEFDVPLIGIEEFNVLFQGQLTGCTLEDPNGNLYTKDSNGAVYVNGRNFLMAKITNPIGGKWKATAIGDPNAKISLRLLYNTNFYIKARLDAPDKVHVGDKVKVIAQIGTQDGIISDTSRYADMTGSVTITEGDKDTEYPMTLGSEGFEYDTTVSKKGTYYISSITVGNDEMKSIADDYFEINVDNQAPKFTGKKLKAHANIWPVLGGKAAVDLNGAAKDADGEKVTYSIDSTAFNDGDYTLKGNKLTVSNFSVPKGSFTIKASDPYGAYCTFDVNFTSTNIGLVMAIAALILGVVIIIVVIVTIRTILGKALMGTLSVAIYDGGRKFPPQVLAHGRGFISVSRFDVNIPELPQGCKFQCDGRNRQVIFVSKKPVYSDFAMGATKKFKIPGDGMEIRISGDQKLEKGIIVSFKSDLPDPMGMSF